MDMEVWKSRFSNGFKHIRKTLDIYATGAVYHSVQEEKFINKVQDKLSICINRMDFHFSETHFTLSIYIDESKTQDNINLMYRENIRDHMIGAYYRSRLKPITNEMDAIADQVVDIFFDMFRLKIKVFENISLSYFSFKRDAIRTAYGLSMWDINDKYSQQPPNEYRRVFQAYDPKIVFRIKSPYFEKMQSEGELDLLRDDCYSIIKQYDAFNFINKDNFAFEIYEWNAVSYKEFWMNPREF